MNTRLLGIFCIAGSVIGVIASLGFQANFENPSSTISWVAGVLLDLGFIAGLVGLILSNAVGSNPVVRALAFLPIIGLLLSDVAAVAELVAAGTPDILTIIGILGFIAGLVLVSILTIAAKTWSGWRRFVPLLVTLMLFAGQLTADRSIGQAVVVAPWVLLGYVVATAEPRPELAQSASA